MRSISPLVADPTAGRARDRVKSPGESAISAAGAPQRNLACGSTTRVPCGRHEDPARNGPADATPGTASRRADGRSPRETATSRVGAWRGIRRSASVRGNSPSCRPGAGGRSRIGKDGRRSAPRMQRIAFGGRRRLVLARGSATAGKTSVISAGCWRGRRRPRRFRAPTARSPVRPAEEAFKRAPGSVEVYLVPGWTGEASARPPERGAGSLGVLATYQKYR